MSQVDLIHRRQSVFVNGEWGSGNGKAPLVVIDPSTGDILTEIPTGGAGDVQAAAAAAAAAFPHWKTTPSATRATYLRGFAKGLKDRFMALVNVQMQVNGKPRMESEIDLGDAIATFEYYAMLADGLDSGQDTPVSHAGGAHSGRVRHEPIGPIGMIVPWNFPIVTSAWKIAPALASGCTAVMKTSEMTPLIELAYADIAMEIGLPAGVLNIVTGATEVGIAMTSAPEFRKVSFTGSNMIGALVMKAVSDRCLPIALELGGKSPIIVTEDADFDTALESVMGGVLYNAGQMCSATSRLIVHENIEARFMEALIERTKAHAVGSPFEVDTMMGPITTRAQFEKIQTYFQSAREAKLDCVAGGGVIGGTGGNFLQPTIYRNVPRDHLIWKEEVFGPVLATTTFKTDKEAVQLANDTHYGLVGSVMCGDPARG